ncbi:hypothetical protein ACIG0C_21430 [Kitasatospora aureofaciens]|uniref:Uncharacterized protein n=1 Tax=Kitasatospora aureofaciens TaxID=1894 RepID=A0A8H9HW74_KITAU|nr:hypothetical protein [Kitasatospora aureofaciens]GGU92171.1 hypothetical protein GCM10010502_51920 [Kitasatospora aureofaciens]
MSTATPRQAASSSTGWDLGDTVVRRVDIGSAQAIRTRARLLDGLADTDALLLGTHFPRPKPAPSAGGRAATGCSPSRASRSRPPRPDHAAGAVRPPRAGRRPAAAPAAT